MKPSAESFSLTGDQYIGRSYSEIDCQKLVELMLRAVGVKKDLAGSNAWYRYCREHGWTGTPEECRKWFGGIPAGAWLFILEHNGKEPEKYKADGLGNASHMGVYIGREDGAIHASASRGCVAYSKFAGKSISGGWNMIGLPTELLDYGPKYGGGNTEEEQPMEQGTGQTATEATVVLPDGAEGNTVNMRKRMAKSSDLVARVPVGSRVIVTADKGAWCAITYDGKNGYMMSNYLEYDGQSGESGGSVTLTAEEYATVDSALRKLEKAVSEAVDLIGSIIGRG